MLKPKVPDYDIGEWRAKPWAERLRMVCLSWATQGYGTPPLIYSVYILKIAFYVYMWSFFCSFTTGMGSLSSLSALSSWCWTPLAFQKALLWSIAFESMGMGCGSGPLTGRYAPPIGGPLYFLRPGTTKLPLFPGLPLVGGYQRTLFDVTLLLAFYGLLLRALIAPALTLSILLPIAIMLPLLVLIDKTLFLIARGEHYWTTLVCFLFVGQWVGGAKLVWMGIWFWAAFSKLNRHFPSVVCVMLSNSPFTGFGPFRKWLYVEYPHDMRPAKLAHFMAHFGTVVEMSFPLVLLCSSGGTTTLIALCVMLLFHTFITGNIPMGVPIEWNVMMVYGGFFLFGTNASVSAFSGTPALLFPVLGVMLLLLPLLGNLKPSMVSFLCSMRYYAGNWAYSVWLFKGDSANKLDTHLTKSAPQTHNQLKLLYDEDTITALLSKVMAWRAMHLQGRALQLLLPKAVDNIEEYEYQDGEIVAGLVLGWNFGDGHLHQTQLLDAVQKQCQFEEGALRCIFVESQPLGKPGMAWKIVDAATGLREEGTVLVKDLAQLQPWPVTKSTSPST